MGDPPSYQPPHCRVSRRPLPRRFTPWGNAAGKLRRDRSLRRILMVEIRMAGSEHLAPQPIATTGRIS